MFATGNLSGVMRKFLYIHLDSFSFSPVTSTLSSHRIQMKWKEAAGYIDTLRKVSKWSRCSMKQIYASTLYMQLENASDEEKASLKAIIDQEMT